MRFKCGDTVLMDTGGKGPHLWIIITEPLPDTGMCVIVSVTTLRFAKDQTVILQRGDHPFIHHQSCIHYSGALIADAGMIESAVSRGAAERCAPCSADILKLVQQGVFASERTPKKVVSFCRSRGRV